MLFIALVSTVGLTVAVMFGISGIQAARERFWPAVFDRFGTAAVEDAEESAPPTDTSYTARVPSTTPLPAGLNSNRGEGSRAPSSNRRGRGLP